MFTFSEELNPIERWFSLPRSAPSPHLIFITPHPNDEIMTHYMSSGEDLSYKINYQHEYSKLTQLKWKTSFPRK